MNQQLYPTDLTDSQWLIIQDLIPPAKPGGRPRSLDMRLVVNAILYIVGSGIQWRMLPKEYPKWQSVYYYFGMWRDDGTWQRIHDTLSCRPTSHTTPPFCGARNGQPTQWHVPSRSSPVTYSAMAQSIGKGR